MRINTMLEEILATFDDMITNNITLELTQADHETANRARGSIPNLAEDIESL